MAFSMVYRRAARGELEAGSVPNCLQQSKTEPTNQNALTAVAACIDSIRGKKQQTWPRKAVIVCL